MNIKGWMAFLAVGAIVSPVSPFTMAARLLTLDKSGYRNQDPFVYEIALRNTGNQPISFPWSADSSLFDETLPDGTFVQMGLADVNDPGSTGQIGLVLLYGSASVPGSLESIRPGDTVRIRVGSDWMDASQGIERLQVVIRPTRSGISYDDIKSDNTIAVHALGP